MTNFLRPGYRPPEFGGKPPENGRQPSRRDGSDGTFGSEIGAEGLLKAVYLLPRLGPNLQILPLHEVSALSNLHRTSARELDRGEICEFEAKRVTMAAGTMKTVKLLCKASERGHLSSVPVRVQGFGTNGDCRAIWKLGGDRDSTHGAGGHGRIFMDGVERDGDFGMFIAGNEPPPLPH